MMVRWRWTGPHILVAVALASSLAIVLIVAPRGRTAPARAQSPSSPTPAPASANDLLKELAQRLLGTAPPYSPVPGGLSGGPAGSPVQLLPGALPTDLPVPLPLPPNSLLIGSAERPSFAQPTPFGGPANGAASAAPAPSGQYVDVVLDVPGTPADIASFYTTVMARLGWSPPARNMFGPGGGGFLPSSGPGSSTIYCQSANGPWLMVTILPTTRGPQDVRLTLDTGNAGPCGSPFPPGGPAPQPPPGFGLLPALPAPPDVSVQLTGGSSGGPGRWTSDASAATDKTASDIETLYEPELVAAGWTRVDGGRAPSLAWSMWSIPNQSDWQGFLYVWSGPGNSRRSLHIEVASASAIGAGPYDGSGSTTGIAASGSASAVATPTALPNNSLSSTPAAYVKQHSLLLINEAPRPGQGGGGPMTSSISTVHAGGTGKTLLTNDGGAPSWTPDGNIIFASTRSGSQQVWIMDADGSNPRQIGQTTSNPVMPQAATNGLIAFMGQSAEGGIGEQAAAVWIMQTDGSDLRELVAHGMQPSLALSGTWLTFTQQTENPYHRQIWRINTDGSGLQQLTFLGDPEYPDANASAISPDETTVALFSGKEADEGAAGLTQSVFTFGQRNVAVIPATGGARTTLTPCQPVTTPAELDAATEASGTCIAADNPAWSPDSQWLIFDTGFSTGGGTWMVDSGGQNYQQFSSQGRGIVRVPLKYVK